MKKLFSILCTVSALSFLHATAREVTDLNFGWEFNAGNDIWRSVDLPHDFQIEQPWVAPDANERGNMGDQASNVKSRLSPRAFKEMGKGTYRRTITPDASIKGKRVLLDFEGIMLVGDVYLNGEHVGKTDYGYLGFEVDVTDKLKYGEPNELVVIADTGEPLSSRWYTGGGLYRGVKMLTQDHDLYLGRHGIYVTTPQISAEKATIVVQADVVQRSRDKDLTVLLEITDPNGVTISRDTQTIPVNGKWRNREYTLAPVEIPTPALWDCEHPNMYTARVTLLRPDGTEADSAEVPFGIRSLEYSPEFGLKLNGKKVLLKGIANHHTLGALGAAAYPRAIEKRIQMLKDFGFNHIRSSHNPYSEEFLNLCDRNGILVVDELYDKWLKQYSGGRKEWTDQWQTDVPEFIKRDRNHPSVIMWSLGNELQGYNNLPYNDWGVTAYRLQKELLHRYDNTRPVTVAMHPRFRSLDTDSLPAPLVHETDIASYNYRYMYFPGDSKRFPNLIFYQSEANLANMGPNFFEPDNDKVLGLAYWGMIDYLGESNGWPAKGWIQGVFDISLQPKPRAWFVKSMFSDEPVVHIGISDPNGTSYMWNDVLMKTEDITDHWNFNAGDTLSIFTYTNADEVELKINGRSIGRKANNKDDNRQRNKIMWKGVKYAPGYAEAIAYNNGKVVARHRIETAGRPIRLVAEPDNDAWRADGMDLQHVRIRAVDSKGRTYPLASHDLKFTLTGDAKLAALSNGDNYSEELNAGVDSRRLYRGTALAILRSGRTPGDITLTVSAPGLKSVKLPLITK